MSGTAIMRGFTTRDVLQGQGRDEPGLIIAIDGPAGVGKSTVAKLLASRLGYLYLDTGALYRALAWAVIESGVTQQIPKRLPHCCPLSRSRCSSIMEPRRCWSMAGT